MSHSMHTFSNNGYNVLNDSSHIDHQYEDGTQINHVLRRYDKDITSTYNNRPDDRQLNGSRYRNNNSNIGYYNSVDRYPSTSESIHHRDNRRHMIDSLRYTNDRDNNQAYRNKFYPYNQETLNSHPSQPTSIGIGERQFNTQPQPRMSNDNYTNETNIISNNNNISHNYNNGHPSAADRDHPRIESIPETHPTDTNHQEIKSSPTNHRPVANPNEPRLPPRYGDHFDSVEYGEKRPVDIYNDGLYNTVYNNRSNNILYKKLHDPILRLPQVDTNYIKSEYRFEYNDRNGGGQTRGRSGYVGDMKHKYDMRWNDKILTNNGRIMSSVRLGQEDIYDDNLSRLVSSYK